MNEVLTRSSGSKKISRITLGALEDMGYVVNYTAADPFGIDDIGSSCSICPEVRRRLTKDKVPVPTSKSSCHHKGEAYNAAIQHGTDLHRKAYESHEASLKLDTLPNGLMHTGNHRGVVTYYSEDGTLCSTSIPPR